MWLGHLLKRTSIIAAELASQYWLRLVMHQPMIMVVYTRKQT